MRKQSDFGRLFHRRPLGLQKPLENYSSEALAIAIEHDDRPLVTALRSIVWPGVAPFDSSRIRRIEPATQHHLPAAVGIRQGYLDLVLDLTLDDATNRVAWVEVKVEAFEHGEQLDVYAEHARRQKPQPIIFALSNHEVRPSERHPVGVQIGWLTWSSVVNAVLGTQDADERWHDLVARPPIPSTL